VALIPDGLDATLVLLRHGESTYIAEGRFQGQADVPLSPLGQRQAELAAARLADPARSPVLPIPRRPPHEIVHSPLRRTARTAELAATAIGEQTGSTPLLRPDAGFLEIAQGAWEGLHRTEIESRYADLLAGWRRSPLEANAPGGERVVDVAARAADGLRRLLDRLAAAPPVSRSATTAVGYPPPVAPDTPWTLLVAHDGIFKIVLLTLLDLPLERFWRFPFAVCGISVVEIRAGVPVLRAHNLTEHLAPLLDEIAVAETEERQRSGAL
jgi:probable phosphoglycerate mutase